jgi:ABC-type transport system substrate-binding protein
MRHSAYRYLAASSLALAAVLGRAATRPRYGGTLRLEVQATVASLHPPERPNITEAAALNKLRDLVYDRLVRLDRRGQPAPALALAWERDEQAQRWGFKLRPGVKWQDGTPLTPDEVFSALKGITPGGAIHLAGETLEINTGRPRPDLLMALALDPGMVIERPAASGALPLGTGPFRVSQWQPGRHAMLEANEDYWDGRPFLDKIEVVMGRSSRDQLLDLESGGADVVQLDPGEARRAQQEKKNVWTSAPVELLWLAFASNRPVVQDRRVREALADTVDRTAIQKVLAQNYGEATGSIFPQWLSGYSFLFPVTRDLGRARQLTVETGTLPPLKLGYDGGDALARQMAERIAVNAHDAGLTVQVSPLPYGWQLMPDPGADVRVERASIAAPNLNAALIDSGSHLGFWMREPQHFPLRIYTPEEIYEAERKFLEDFHVVPLLYVPELVGLGPRVRDWSALPWGDWRLPDVWLEAEKP